MCASETSGPDQVCALVHAERSGLPPIRIAPPCASAAPGRTTRANSGCADRWTRVASGALTISPMPRPSTGLNGFGLPGPAKGMQSDRHPALSAWWNPRPRRSGPRPRPSGGGGRARVGLDGVEDREFVRIGLAEKRELTVERASVIDKERRPVFARQHAHGNPADLKLSAGHAEVAGDEGPDVIHRQIPWRRRNAG